MCIDKFWFSLIFGDKIVTFCHMKDCWKYLLNNFVACSQPFMFKPVFMLCATEQSNPVLAAAAEQSQCCSCWELTWSAGSGGLCRRSRWTRSSSSLSRWWWNKVRAIDVCCYCICWFIKIISNTRWDRAYIKTVRHDNCTKSIIAVVRNVKCNITNTICNSSKCCIPYVHVVILLLKL